MVNIDLKETYVFKDSSHRPKSSVVFVWWHATKTAPGRFIVYKLFYYIDVGKWQK
jgi:hypothetical protein